MFELTSSSFSPEGHFLSGQLLSSAFGFGCHGADQSPQLSWSGFPEETRSFAVTCFDHSAPIVCGFWHWMAVNIPVHVNDLVVGASGDLASLGESVIQIRNDFSVAAYSGPCPPPGDAPHRYEFVLHALGCEKLGVSASTSAALTMFMISHASLASASLNATYGRKA